MTTLPEFFTASSDGEYDRHKYKVHMQSGKIIDFDWYDDARAHWMQNPFCKVITIHDRKKKR